MESKRILVLSDRLSQRGGADWYLLGKLREWAAAADVVLAVGRDDGSARAPCPVQLIDGLDAPRRRAVAPALDGLAGAFAPDEIRVHNTMNPEALEWAAARRAVMAVQDHRVFCPGRGKLTLEGRPCVEPMSRATCAGCFTDDDYAARIGRLTEARLAAVTRMARLTVLSEYMKNELVAVGVDAARIDVEPPVVRDLDLDAAPAGGQCVLFAGRLVGAKGVDDAVEAWHRSNVALPLVFAGTGPERGRLEARGFEVLGWAPHDRMSGVYRRARALLVPSRWQEPFGIVGIEALAFGIPVVAYDSGGIREWHPGPGLVPWGDVAALAGALKAALEEPDLHFHTSEHQKK